ncbi:MAG: ABC transporter ATP-binding protein [Candidatus Acidulodesulfobacterium acidiphilum]|uniref:ABC transporter ATP-binding protein n=1 Tax=Candidatus Acidulodesulfobacterium acidiphilum TaxID=2597224 RepID=A0A520XES3_9DELT|nr:MAG: ABC transporter ATP-binding protein [Candidatus Acidulodesulfobacterium acidiphilum]
MEKYILEINGLTKNFNRLKVLSEVSFKIKYGDFFGLIGPNGAGKSTLLKILYGIVIPDSGNISINGLDFLYNYKKIKYSLGIVPQEDNLDEDLSVNDNLTVYSKYFGITGVESRRRANELLNFFDMGEKKYFKVSELSGGLKRRLMIARALINNPSLIILDEPTSGLDPEYRQNIWEKLKALNRNGVTILMSTHYMEEAERLFKNIIILNHGNIVFNGAISEITLNKKSLEEIFLDITKT